MNPEKGQHLTIISGGKSVDATIIDVYNGDQNQSKIHDLNSYRLSRSSSPSEFVDPEYQHFVIEPQVRYLRNLREILNQEEIEDFQFALDEALDNPDKMMSRNVKSNPYVREYIALVTSANVSYLRANMLDPLE